jgi:hypothetical protein
MIMSDAMQAIMDLDLEQIKVKLMHPSGEGWTLAKAAVVETEYRRFLYLAKVFPAEPKAPGVSVDLFWHYHILDTQKYASDCAAAFGYFVHHYPSVGLSESANDAAARDAADQHTRSLYARWQRIASKWAMRRALSRPRRERIVSRGAMRCGRSRLMRPLTASSNRANPRLPSRGRRRPTVSCSQGKRRVTSRARRPPIASRRRMQRAP